MIILVRHGEATHHTQHLTGGWTDSDLTEAGRSQLEALAEKLALDFKGRSEKFRILASDLKRAAESAAACIWTVKLKSTRFCAKKTTALPPE